MINATSIECAIYTITVQDSFGVLWCRSLALLYPETTTWCYHRVSVSHTGTLSLSLCALFSVLLDHSFTCTPYHISSGTLSPVACDLSYLYLNTHSLHSQRPAFFHSLCVLDRGRLRAWVLGSRQRESYWHLRGRGTETHTIQYKYSTVQRCDRVYTKLIDIVYRVPCIVYTRTYTKFYKYTKIHTRNF